MFIVILFIFLGIGIGYAVRTRTTSAPLVSAVNKWSGKATTWLIWLLLFMLGLEVGSDRHIIARLRVIISQWVYTAAIGEMVRLSCFSITPILMLIRLI